MYGYGTVTIPYGPDWSVCTAMALSPFGRCATHWTDGGRAGLFPSKTVTGQLSRLSDGLDGYVQTPNKQQLQMRTTSTCCAVTLPWRIHAFFIPYFPFPSTLSIVSTGDRLARLESQTYRTCLACKLQSTDSGLPQC